MATIARYQGRGKSRDTIVFTFSEDEHLRIVGHLNLPVLDARVMVMMRGQGNGSEFALVGDSKGLKIFLDQRGEKANYSVAPTDQMLPKMSSIQPFGATPVELDFEIEKAVGVKLPRERRPLIVRNMVANRQPGKALVPAPVSVPLVPAAVHTTEVLVGDVLCDVPFNEALALVAKYARR